MSIPDKDLKTLGQNTFIVTYSDESSEIVKPVSWKILEDVEELQYQLIQTFYYNDLYIGSTIRKKNVDFWDNAKKLAAIMPIVGKEDPGFNPENIDDPDMLCRIFLTASLEKNKMGQIEATKNPLLPSDISKINNINFSQLLRTMIQNVEIHEAAKAKQEQKRKPLPKK